MGHAIDGSWNKKYIIFLPFKSTKMSLYIVHGSPKSILVSRQTYLLRFHQFRIPLFDRIIKINPFEICVLFLIFHAALFAEEELINLKVANFACMHRGTTKETPRQ